jgi:hypothetical protein
MWQAGEEFPKEAAGNRWPQWIRLCQPSWFFEQIAGVVISFSQRHGFQALNCDWNEERQANTLTDHDAKIFDGEFRQRLSPQSVTGVNEIRTESRLSPVVLFEILKRLGPIQPTIHGGFSLDPIAWTVSG